MGLCIKNATLISMSDKYNKIEKDIDILIEDKNIIKIDRNIEITKDDVIIDAKGKVVMPGLINTHAHIPMSIFRETLDGYNLQEWLMKKIWPMEDNLTKEDMYYASYLSYIEMIKCGTTTINDMYFMTDRIIDAAIDSGIRLQTSRTIMGNINNDMFRFEELTNLYNKYKNDRISFNLGLHGLYTTNLEYIRECIKYNDTHNFIVHTHFCENEEEVNNIKKIYNNTPINILKNNFNEQKLLLAHCVKLSKEDIKELSTLNVSVSHCPVSNLKLGCGIANIKEMINNNINVSLGTDGQGSGSNLDLFETMKFTALLQKGINEDPTLLTSYDVLKMATVNGAIALGLQDNIGSIEPGKLADIIILDIDDIKIKPVNNLISEIVYNVKGNNVITTIINGKILMKDRVLVNDVLSDIEDKCNSIIDRIMG